MKVSFHIYFASVQAQFTGEQMADSPTQLGPLFLRILQDLALALRCLKLLPDDDIHRMEAVQNPTCGAQYDFEALVWKWTSELELCCRRGA
jgi:hypothetical protein